MVKNIMSVEKIRKLMKKGPPLWNGEQTCYKPFMNMARKL